MREQFHNLQILRGVACLAVVVFHVATAEAWLGQYFSPLWLVMWVGYAGVDLFFVLSGFVIATAIRPDVGRPARLPRYLFRRAWRVYPTYWVIFALVAVVLGSFAAEPVVAPFPSVELRNTLLLLPEPFACKVLGVVWTLWYEVAFYAVLAVLFVLPRRAAVPALAGWAAAVVAVNAAGLGPANQYARTDHLLLSPFVLEFLAGALLAWVPARLTGRQAAGLAAVAAAWCVGLSAVLFDPDPAWLPASHARRVLVFGGPGAVLVFALAGWERAGGRLKWPWLERVGHASYSVYLLHSALIFLTGYLAIRVGWPHSRVAHTVWLAALLVAGVVPALCFHRFVEQPLLNLARRRRPDLAPVASAGVAPVPTRRAA